MNAPLYVSDPLPGFYRRRLVKGGPWVPARIFYSGDGLLLCEVNGISADPLDAWTWLAGHPISEDEFRWRTETMKWASGTNAPEATPSEPIDLMTTPIPF